MESNLVSHHHHVQMNISHHHVTHQKAVNSNGQLNVMSTVGLNPINVKMILDTHNGTSNGFKHVNHNNHHHYHHQQQQQQQQLQHQQQQVVQQHQQCNMINNTNNTNKWDINAAMSINRTTIPQSRWKLVCPKLMAIVVCNFHYKAKNSVNTSNEASNYLQLFIGDVVVIVEQCDQWFRGYVDGDCANLGLFPSTFVQVFDENLNLTNCANTFTTFYFTLMDPLFLQVVRTLREWHQHLIGFYRTNTNQEKYQTVRKLMYELIDLCATLSKEWAPSLWRKRSAQLLEINSANSKDPFAKLYLDEDDADVGDEQSTNNGNVMEPSLEELYERILSKLNLGNHLLNLDIMPSFTHGTFSNDHSLNYSHLVPRNTPLIQRQHNEVFVYRRRSKLKPYYMRKNSKYLTFILDYYNRLCKKFAEKTCKTNNRSSLSFHSPLHTNSQQQVGSSSLQTMAAKKYRRHLLFSIREANFSSLFTTQADSDQCPLLQIDVYLVRCHNNSVTCADSSPYEILTEKYCYRVSASGQLLSPKGNGFWTNVNRALFLDVLSKKSSSNSNQSHFSSQHTDSANYYLVIQVWRYGKMLNNESRTKNMLTATMSTASASLSTGSSVFHTISSSSISSAATAVAAAASTTSLSSLTSFVSNVSNSSLFSTDKTTASSTPDSTSIDSSEFGAASFKRSVGFAVVPLLELVSRDQEIKQSNELLNSEAYISRLLLADEHLLVSVPIKLYEGDLTVSALESVLKHRQATGIATHSSFSTASSTTASISKLSPLTASYQLIVCAKFISELLPPNNCQISKKFPTTQTENSVNSNISVSPNSLGDFLLLTQNDTTNNKTEQQPNFVLVQKRSFGDLMTAGYFRNDFYLTLEGVDFEKGGRFT